MSFGSFMMLHLPKSRLILLIIHFRWILIPKNVSIVLWIPILWLILIYLSKQLTCLLKMIYHTIHASYSSSRHASSSIKPVPSTFLFLFAYLWSSLVATISTSLFPLFVILWSSTAAFLLIKEISFCEI